MVDQRYWLSEAKNKTCSSGLGNDPYPGSDVVGNLAFSEMNTATYLFDQSLVCTAVSD